MPASAMVLTSHTGSAVTASTASTASHTRLGGLGGGIYVLAAYSSDFTTGAASSADFGGVALGFIGGKTGAAGNVSVEIWGAAAKAGAYPDVGTGTITFPGGTSDTIIVAVVEIAWVGAQTAPAFSTANGSGLTSPITSTITASDVLGGRQGTIGVPASNAILLSIGALYRNGTGANMSIQNGTEIVTRMSAGSGATEIQMACAYTQATGGADVLSWTESVDREWAELMIEVSGSAVDGNVIIRTPGLLPAYV